MRSSSISLGTKGGGVKIAPGPNLYLMNQHFVDLEKGLIIMMSEYLVILVFY